MSGTETDSKGAAVHRGLRFIHFNRGHMRVAAVEWKGRFRGSRLGLCADGAFCSRLMLMDIEIPSMEGMKGVLTDASQLLLNSVSSQQLYTSRLFYGVLLTDSARVLAILFRDKRYQRSDEGWLGVRTMYLSSAVNRGVIRLRTDEKRPAADEYATGDYFCRIFQVDMQSLYLLAFLLTASREHAERCFLAGIEEALNERIVFSEWARCWSRRILIKNAIRLIAPGSLNRMTNQTVGPEQTTDRRRARGLDLCSTSFDRIVFVMSVLEGYSDWECASLLDGSARDVQGARIRALQQLPGLYPAMAG